MRFSRFPSTRRGRICVLAALALVAPAILTASDPPTITVTQPPPASVAEDSAPFDVQFLVSPDTSPPEKDDVTAFAVVSVVPADVVSASTVPAGLPWSKPTSVAVTVTPLPNAFGTATITVQAVDALGDIATQSFDVTVDPVNDAPTISDIPDQVTGQDTPTAAIPFTVGDVETAAGLLTVSATSTNQALAPDANLLLGGSGGSRTLTITPVAGQTGTATITVTVADGVATASDTFVLTVQPANPPSISPLADATIAEDTALAPVAFTVSDADGLLAPANAVVAASGNQALVPNANLSISGGPGVGPYTIAATPLPDQHGTTTITITATDHTGLTAQASFLLTVTPVNDAPSVLPIPAQSTSEDVAHDVTVIISDVDAGDAFTVSAVSSDTAVVAQGGLSVTGAGNTRTLTITPVPDASGTTTITVTAEDNGTPPLQSQQSFVLTVTAVNDAPLVAPIGDATTPEDTPAAVSLVYSDVDTALTSPPFTFTVTSSNATLLPNANAVVTGTTSPRTLTLTPAANQVGTTVVTVTASDGLASSFPVSFTLTVTGVNDPPTIDPVPAQVTNEDVPKVVAITVGDPDPGDTLTVTALSSNTTVVANSGLVITGTGASRTLTITPVANASGSTTITLSVTDDGTPPLATQTSFQLTVDAVNDAPVVSAIPDQVTPEDTAAVVSLFYSDVDTPLTSPPFGFTLTSSNTTLVPNANLALSGTTSPRTLTITPAADQVGTTTITVTASDGSSSSAPVSFTVTVNGVNDPPVVSPIANASASEDTNAVVSVIYSDPDTPLTSPPFVFTITSSNTALVPNGNLVLTGASSPRTLTVTPAANQSGTTTITVVASDGALSSAPVAFDLTVTAVNDAPTLAAIGPQATTEDVAKAVPITVGDPDAGDTLTVTATSSVQAVVADAGLVVAGAGASRTLTITPAANASGTTTITVTVVDNGVPPLSAQQSFVLTVDPFNDPPTISGIGAQAVAEDTATGALAFTVSDVETPAGSLIVTAASDTPSVVPVANIVFGGSGGSRTVTVTPAANAFGTATITLTVADLNLPPATASTAFTITVAPVNDAPTISDIGNLSTSKGVATAPITFTVGDIETAAGSLTVTAVSSDQNVLPNSGIALGGSGTNRTITLAPPVNGQIGPATVTVTVSDGAATAQDTFVLTVNPPDAPTISPIADQTIAEDTSLAPLAFTVNDPQGTGPASIVSVTAASSNQAIVPNSGITVGGSGGARTIAVVPAPNRFTTALDRVSITVTVTDHTGLTATASFQLNITPVNDAPTIDAIPPQTTNEDVAKSVTITVGDVDPGDVLTVTATSLNQNVVANGALVVTGTGSSRTLTITPVANASGSATITVSVTDNASPPLSAQRQFALTVNAVNDPPTILSPGNKAIDEDTTGGPYTVTVGDVETSAGGLVLTATSGNTTLIPASGITLGGSGASRTITVVPAKDQSGTATITLTVTDLNVPAAQTTTTFVVTVNAVNDAPVITQAPGNWTIAEDGTFSQGVTVSDVDTSLAQVTVSATSDNATLLPASGISVTGTGSGRTLTLAPAQDQFGAAKITITAGDGFATSAPRQFTLTVTPVNDAPTISDLGPGLQVVVNASTAAIPFAVNDVDDAASGLSITATSSNTTLVRPAGLVLGGSGTSRTLTVTPELNRTGVTLITVTVMDNKGLSASDSLALTVNDVTCTFSAKVAPLSFVASGGAGVVEMDAARGADPTGTGCAWTVGVAEPWVSVASPGNGFGDGALMFAVAPNSSLVERTAVVTVAGRPFTITQLGAPVPCTYTLSSKAVPAEGGAFTLAVTSNGSGCQPFTASTAASWLAVTSVSPAAVSLLAAANPDTVPRSATVTLTSSSGVARGVVDQAAAGACTYLVTPDSLPFGPAGGQRALSIAVPSGCGWSVASNVQADWLTVAPDAGFGNGGVVVAAASNDGGAERAVSLLVRNAAGVEVARVRVAQDSVTGGDADGDGLPSQWEAQFGLDSLSGTGADGALGDPDGDGLTNLDELRNCDLPKVGCTHPRGFSSRFLPEGAQSGFFQTRFALLNPGSAEARVLLRFQRGDGTAVTQYVAMPALSRRTVFADGVAGLNPAEFATVVEADQAVVVDRTMSWDRTGYGSHAETGLPAPRTTWYLAEGATIGNFDLFYLVQNPSTQAAEISVEFLLPSGPPVVKAYTVGPGSRFNIWVNQIPELAHAEVSAVIRVTNGVPVLVERAMYLSAPGQLFAAGHESAAVSAPATEWFLAEGATGDFFDLFVLVANPQSTAANIEVDYLLSDGTVITKPYTIAPRSRFNIWVDLEDPRLAKADVSTVVRVTNDVPVIVERAMWWPGPTAATWNEAHNSAGTTRTATRWALAEGEQGGPSDAETYVLIANTSSTAGQARVRLIVEDGPVLEQVVSLLPRSRSNVAIGAAFPEALGKRFGVIVEAIGANPVQLVVERAMYTSPGGVMWTAGTNALATPLP